MTGRTARVISITIEGIVTNEPKIPGTKCLIIDFMFRLIISKNANHLFGLCLTPLLSKHARYTLSPHHGLRYKTMWQQLPIQTLSQTALSGTLFLKNVRVIFLL